MQVLTDTHGRILTQHDPDGDVRTAVVWVPGDSRIDWDDASDQELVTLLGKYGYNDALTIENNNVTINDNGETETLAWDSAAMDFTVDVDMFQNGEQNMFFRTVNDGSQDVTVLCDADGKAIHAPELGSYQNVLFTVSENGTKIDTITSGSSISREGVSNACGGDVNVTALDAGASVFLLVKGTHIQYCNADDLTTFPAVTRFPTPEPPVPIVVRGFRVNNGLLEYLNDGNWVKVTWNHQLIPGRLVNIGDGYIIEFDFTPSPLDEINNFNIVTNGTEETSNVIEALMVSDNGLFRITVGEWSSSEYTVGDETPIVI